MNHQRWLLSGIFWLLCSFAMLSAQEPASERRTESSLDTQLAAQPAQRDVLREEALKLAAEGKLTEAVAAGEQVLKLDRESLGEDHPEVTTTLKWMAELHEAAESWQAAEACLKEVLQHETKRWGAENWQVTDARLAVEHVRHLASITPEHRTQLRLADQWAGQFLQLYQGGQFVPAIRLAEQVRELRRDFLGKEHPDYATSVNYLSLLYRSMGDYARAESLLCETLEIQEKVLGKEHPDYASSLDNLASVYESMENFERAIPMHQEAMAIREKVLGKEHPDYAASVNNMAVVYQKMGDNAKVETLLLEAKAIVEKVLGKEHPNYASSLNNLASLYYSIRDYERAEQFYFDALAIRKQLLGKEHPDYAMSLRNLALVHVATSEGSKAEPLLLEAKAVVEKVLGKEHPDYVMILNGLASLMESQGDYAQAEPLYLEMLSIIEKVLGKKHTVYTTKINNLAGLYTSMGRYTKAERLFQEAINILENSRGKENPEYALSLENLAVVYQKLGHYQRAMPMFQEALAIRQKVQGKEHPDYANSLNNLAVCYVLMGDYIRAEPLLNETMTSVKKLLRNEDPVYAMVLNNVAALYQMTGAYKEAETLYDEAASNAERFRGKEHPDYANCLNNLASLHEVMDDYMGAERRYMEALAIRRKVLGKQHPLVAQTLHNLAGLYKSVGDHVRAESLYLEALAINENVVGKEHPDYANSLHGLATLYQSMGDDSRAEPLFRESLKLSRQVLENSALVQSERQQLAMNQMLRHRLDGFLSMALATGKFQATAAQELLSWKGATLVRQRAMRLAADDPAISDRFRELQSVIMRLASLSRSVPTENLNDWRERMLGLTAEKEILEAQLSRDSVAFREVTQTVTLEQIQAAMPPDSVLVDYLQFQRGRPSEEKGSWTFEESLLATIIPAHGEPVLMDLGAVVPISAAIDTWRQTYGMSPHGKTAGQQLRQQIWEPVLVTITQMLPTTATEAESVSPDTTPNGLLLISADGVLGRLPLAGLPGRESGTYLVEDHRLAMIPVPQLLPALVNDRDRKKLSRELLLLGDVDYDAEPQMAAQEPRKRPRPHRAVETEQPLGPLDETRGEIAAIKKSYADAFEMNPNDVMILEKSQATEARFRELAPQFYHLHLATHGFFAPESMVSALSPQKGGGRFGLASDDAQVRGYNPGLLSGLAFAGANRPPVDDADDGILTAEEIAFLPLGGVDTVVLSACETGLGNTAGGEGLLGVQRAFQIAGARTTVASFWKVHDLVTRVLMERFYRNLWEKEMPRLEALREAQLHVLNHPEAIRGATLEEGEEQQTRVSPFYWAAFTLSGDWR